MSFFSAAWTIARKDMRVYFRDRGALMLGFLMPIALVTLFGLLMGQAFSGGGPMPKATLWIADYDRTATSEKLIESLRAAEMLKVRPREGEEVDPDAVTAKVSEGDAGHVLVVEAGFGEGVAAGEDRGLRLIRDPGRKMEDQLIRISLLQSMFAVRGGDYWTQMMQHSLRDAGMPEIQVQAFSLSANSMTAVIGDWIDDTEGDETEEAVESVSPMGFMTDAVPIETEDVAPPDRPKQLTYQLAQSVAGMAVMMLMFGMVGCSTMLLTERDEGTMQRLVSASVPHASILWSKVIFTVFIGMLQMTVMMLYGEMLFHVGVFRDPITLIVLSLVWTLAATSFGMLIATISKTARQAEALAPIVILTLAALGGCWFPLQMLDLPMPMELATKSTVTYWAMAGFQGYFWDSFGLTNGRILVAIAVQLGFAAVMMLLSKRQFQRNFLAG